MAPFLFFEKDSIVKKYIIFGFMLLLHGCGSVPTKEHPPHEHARHEQMEHALHAGGMPGTEDQNHREHDTSSPHSKDFFGGFYKSMGADCGSFILCPASSPHDGYHAQIGDWNFMAHGFMSFIYTEQPEPRGESGFAAPSHFMFMGDRALFGGHVRLTLGTSLDALTESKWGKAQLLQTGELYQGRENVDVQHRHPLITNLSAIYTREISVNGLDSLDWFCSAALVGDASGVPMEFHRASAKRLVDTSLFHHGTTDKHITSSVFLCGFDIEKFRVAAAVFHGQEPGSNPYSLYIGAPDSFAGSLQYAPTRNWTFSLYYADIHNAERVEPGDIKRVTVGAMHVLPLSGGDWWATSAIFTHDEKEHGSANMFVLDSTLRREKNSFYGRIDVGEKEGVFLGINTYGRPGLESSAMENAEEKHFLIGAGTIGYARTLWQSGNAEFGAGVDITGYAIPDEAEKVYGSFPISANMYLFVNF
jgi:hypothetical protein